MNIQYNNKPILHLVFGPTATGKSTKAAELARLYSAPVVVMDRVQSFPELRVGSNRIQHDAQSDVSFLYLKEASIADGRLSPLRGHSLLMDRVAEASREYDCVVLEGGSISLLKEFARSLDYWKSQYQLRFHIHCVDDWTAYLKRVIRRMEDMVSPDNQGSLLTEFARNYHFMFSRDPWIFQEVVGYVQILEWKQRHGASIYQLLNLKPGKHMSEIVTSIAKATVEYAMKQQFNLVEFATENGLLHVLHAQLSSGEFQAPKLERAG